MSWASLTSINEGFNGVTSMDPAIVFGVLLYFFGFVALVIYSAHRRKKQMSQQPIQQPQPQSSSMSEFRSHQESEKEDLGLEDSEGDGLIQFDDPMFPPDPRRRRLAHASCRIAQNLRRKSAGQIKRMFRMGEACWQGQLRGLLKEPKEPSNVEENIDPAVERS